jgi:hypothetical protein
MGPDKVEGLDFSMIMVSVKSLLNSRVCLEGLRVFLSTKPLEILRRLG